MIHVGDSVSFAINGFHTVSFLSGAAPPGLIVPAPTNPVSGKLDAGGAAFWFNGQPNQIINPMVGAPAGGKQHVVLGEKLLDIGQGVLLAGDDVLRERWLALRAAA